MSIKVMSWVWENSPASGSGLLLLLAIADHADDDGTAYPSIQKLAKKTRMSRSSVFRAMKPLIESRQLKIESRGTGRDTSEYQIIMPPSRGVNLTPQGSQDDTPGVAERHPRGVNVDTPGVSLLTHRTVNEPSVVTTTTSSAPADAATGHRDEPPAPKIKPLARFDDFWKIYPLKKGKLAAQKAFTKAVTGGADPQAIIDGALEYAFECRMKEPKYVKYAQGWLNDGRWQDESAP
ncbi:MAG: helix-turn-helix domain-containing protein, partial [Actinocrinis sp.]